MVEIKHGEHKELVQLTGKTIAEVREEYREEFDIPKNSNAILNGKTVKKSMESKIVLEECDELSFVEKKRSRVPILATAIMLALAITGGVFAYTYTTASATLTLTSATGDFASISTNATGVSSITWKPFGKYRGVIPAGTVFNVTPTTGYTGDVEVKVYLSNMDELTKNYSFYMMRLRLENSLGTPVDAEGIEQILTMENGVASFYFPSSNFTPGTTYYVVNKGGSYIGFPFASGGWATTYDPTLYAQVTQAG